MASHRNILFALWLLVFSSASQIMILGPILPRIGEELGVDTSLLMNAYAEASTSAQAGRPVRVATEDLDDSPRARTR